MSAPFQPELFGDFLLVQRLSRRAMAEVLVAVRLGDRSGRTLVLKRPVLGERASGRAAQAIAREGEVLAAVRGAGLPQLEARGELAGLPYVAIEHVRGAPLDELIAAGGGLEPGPLRALALDLARALGALHEKGFIHGDVAPSNVIVDDAGEARLVDLGLARRIGETTGELAGTPGYVAPEAALPGEARPALDVYGWAAVVAECALGRPIHAEKELASAATRGEPPRELRAWEEHLPGLGAALSRDPAARPETASLVAGFAALSIDRSALAERVDGWMRGETNSALTPTAPMVVEARPAPGPTPAPQRLQPTVVEGLSGRAPTAPRASPARWISVVALVGLAFAAGSFSSRRGASPPPPRQAWVSFGTAVPARAQIELDGQKVPSPADGRLLLAPGEHTLTVVLPKGARREYTFHVRPNENVVLLPPRRPAGSPDEGTEDREP
ncbi:serine/threonine protein kinase [Polyangium aurulentum]|uniref:serine/threonine protein kinase n=1 Tax=Polyangium aurulentum TaxID=2567896 RepID=UPI0010AE380D|nr:protein kinase [Polyangium aurulentum]UQA62953.1 protein kinase [Polyangium aurulentum]